MPGKGHKEISDARTVLYLNLDSGCTNIHWETLYAFAHAANKRPCISTAYVLVRETDTRKSTLVTGVGCCGRGSSGGPMHTEQGELPYSRDEGGLPQGRDGSTEDH